MEVRSPLTTEYVRVPVAAAEEGAVVNPTADVVQMAVIATGTTPVELDWETAEWETDESTDPDVYYVRLLVGPGFGGALTLAAGSIYDVYVRINDNPETIVKNSGAIGVL